MWVRRKIAHSIAQWNVTDLNFWHVCSVKGECGKTFRWVGSPVLVTSLYWMRSAPEAWWGWGCPYHLSHAESWNHAVQIITFKTLSFNPNSQENAKIKECVILQNAPWMTSPFSQPLFPLMPLPRLLSHHKTHKNTRHTHALSWGCFLQWWWNYKDRANIGS